MTASLLSFEKITFGYNPKNDVVLNRLSLEVQAGIATAILGPNGVGKTTLLYLALGWQKPQGGRILLKGKPLEQYSRQEIGHLIGLVPQSEHITFDYSLMEYVLMGRAPHLAPLEMPGLKDFQIARQALDMVGLSNLQDRPASALSGGERQLLLIARALAQQPRLLLLDEPTSHLDLANKMRVLDVLHNLVLQGVSILLTTHEPEVAAEIATYLVLMRDGQVQHAGPLADEFTTEQLTAVYGVPVQVREVLGRRVAIWGTGVNNLEPPS
jgi:iron complex transport system ATP-binding protein